MRGCKGWRFCSGGEGERRRATASAIWIARAESGDDTLPRVRAPSRRVRGAGGSSGLHQFRNAAEPVPMRPLAAQPGATARMGGAARRNRRGVTRREHADGAVSLAVHGLEFARAEGGRMAVRFRPQDRGFDRSAARRGCRSPRSRLWREVSRKWRDDRQDRIHPLYARHPEAWLESQVRAQHRKHRCALCPQPFYGQVPQFAAGRARHDRPARRRIASGRLAVMEVKASQDIHLPLQALDYWMRVKWHLERRRVLGRADIFRVWSCARDPPRLLLVAPALEFHPSNETVLRFFSPGGRGGADRRGDRMEEGAAR